MSIELLMPGPLLQQASGTRDSNSTYRVICTTTRVSSLLWCAGRLSAKLVSDVFLFSVVLGRTIERIKIHPSLKNGKRTMAELER